MPNLPTHETVEQRAEQVSTRLHDENCDCPEAKGLDYFVSRLACDSCRLHVLTTFAQAEARRGWNEGVEASIKEVEKVKLVHAENESMGVGFVCAKNSILTNLRTLTRPEG